MMIAFDDFRLLKSKFEMFILPKMILNYRMKLRYYLGEVF